jgi:ABC-type glycerol-3-phosphate transport system substrate-binding protein
MKRMLVTGAVATAVALLFSGCSPAADPNAKPAITIWVDATREGPATAYADAVQDDVDVTVEVRDTNNLVADIALANQAGSGWPDLVFGGQPNAIAQLRDPANGFAQPLDELLSADFIDGFGAANGVCEYDGQTFCLKNDLAQTVLWYDVQTFQELGLTPPTTFDEFGETATTLAAAGYVSGALGANALYSGFFESSGCTFTDLDATSNTIVVNPDADECQRVVDLLEPLVANGALDTRSPFDAGFVAEVAQQGKVAMQIGPSWFGDFVYAPADSWAVPEGRTSAAAMPAWGNDDAFSGQWGGGIWTVSSHSEDKQAAADALEWILTNDEAVASGPTFPAYGPSAAVWGAKTAENPFYAEDIIPVFEAQAALVNPGTKAVLFDIDTALNANLSTLVTNGSTIEEALASFAENVTNLAKEVGYTVATE